MNKRWINSLLLLGMAAFSAAPAWSDGHVDRPHDWTLTIETQQMSRQFEYAGSTLRPVVKTEMKYWHLDDDAHKTAYENMWFHDGKPLGMERLHKFEVERGDGLAVNILHKTATPTLGEKKAAADALVHIVLDAYLHRNAVTIVNVPAGSFEDVSNDLQSRHHFIPQEDAGADHPIASGINLFLSSDPPGHTQSLYYF